MRKNDTVLWHFSVEILGAGKVAISQNFTTQINFFHKIENVQWPKLGRNRPSLDIKKYVWICCYGLLLTLAEKAEKNQNFKIIIFSTNSSYNNIVCIRYVHIWQIRVKRIEFWNFHIFSFSQPEVVKVHNNLSEHIFITSDGLFLPNFGRWTFSVLWHFLIEILGAGR